MRGSIRSLPHLRLDIDTTCAEKSRVLVNSRFRRTKSKFIETLLMQSTSQRWNVTAFLVPKKYDIKLESSGRRGDLLRRSRKVPTPY